MNILNIRLDQRDEALRQEGLEKGRQEELCRIAKMLLKAKYGNVPEHLFPILEKGSTEAIEKIILSL